MPTVLRSNMEHITPNAPIIPLRRSPMRTVRKLADGATMVNTSGRAMTNHPMCEVE